MTGNDELKIVFAGPMGAGKTTAIRAISDIEPVSTDVVNNDRASNSKEYTTVALDYGQLLLEDGTTVRLYGTPGQERFSFMWDILSKGALGVILLIDGSTGTATEDLGSYACEFHRLNAGQPFVIGVSRLPQRRHGDLSEFTRILGKHDIVAPVFEVDLRVREDVLLLVQTLLCILETQVASANDAV